MASSKSNNELLVSAENISVAIDGNDILQSASLAISKGEVVTIVGPNGAGKTTLVRSILGLVNPNSGTLFRRPKIKIGYMPQKLHLDPTMPMTVNRFLSLAVPAKYVGQGKRKKVLDEVNITHIANSQIHTIQHKSI